MTADETGLPSYEKLRAEREQVKAQVAQARTLIARSRAAASAAEQRFADSFDRLAESYQLIRRGDSRFANDADLPLKSLRPRDQHARLSARPIA